MTIYLKGNETSNFAMPTLQCSPPSSTWTWIESINIIDVFHLGLPCPHSYQHIMYTLRIDVQWILYIPLFQLTSNPFDIVTLHSFCYSFFVVCPFLHMVVKEATKNFVIICINTWVVTRRFYRKSK